MTDQHTKTAREPSRVRKHAAPNGEAAPFGHDGERAIITTLRFHDSDTVAFAQTGSGMEVTIMGMALPPYEGPVLNPDYVAFLREHDVPDAVVNQMYDAAVDGLYRALALDALMRALVK